MGRLAIGSDMLRCLVVDAGTTFPDADCLLNTRKMIICRRRVVGVVCARRRLARRCTAFCKTARQWPRQSSLRKWVVIGPTLVSPDRLTL